MNRLRGTSPVVVADVLGDDTADVIGCEEDEIVQGLVPQSLHEALGMRGCIRRAVRDR